MRFAYHLAKVVYESVAYGIASRRASVVVLVVVGLALVALAFTAQTVAPLAMYPFA